MALRTSSSPAKEPAAIKLGLLGGTFDPIHIGHLIIAEEARACLGLERVLFVPAKVSPFKLQSTFAPAEDRLRMVELAIAENPHFGISRVDLERRGPSFTVDTLRALRQEYGPATRLYFILGLDTLAGIRHWRSPEEVIRLARLVAVQRPGFTVDWEALERALPGLRAATEVITTIHLGISSTDIRDRLRQGRPIRYQVPAAVERYIREHHLYLAEEHS